MVGKSYFLMGSLLMMMGICLLLGENDSVLTPQSPQAYTYIFAHGLGGDCRQVEPYKMFGVIPAGACSVLSKNGPEVGKGTATSFLT